MTNMATEGGGRREEPALGEGWSVRLPGHRLSYVMSIRSCFCFSCRLCDHMSPASLQAMPTLHRGEGQTPRDTCVVGGHGEILLQPPPEPEAPSAPSTPTHACGDWLPSSICLEPPLPGGIGDCSKPRGFTIPEQDSKWIIQLKTS